MSATWLGTATPWLEYYRGRPAAQAEDQRRAEDKHHIAAMAPKWRAQRRERAEQAFQQWKADRQEHAARLFAEVNGGEGWGFPPPSHFCATLWSTPER